MKEEGTGGREEGEEGRREGKGEEAGGRERCRTYAAMQVGEM